MREKRIFLLFSDKSTLDERLPGNQHRRVEPRRDFLSFSNRLTFAEEKKKKEKKTTTKRNCLATSLYRSRRFYTIVKKNEFSRS